MNDMYEEYIKLKEIRTAYDELVKDIDRKIADIDSRLSEIATIINKSIFPSISTEFESIKEQMCDGYCKYPDLYASMIKDPDKANERMMAERCEHCPLERL